MLLTTVAAVYGGAIPAAMTFPWCVGGLWMLYADVIAAHKVTTPASVGPCPTNKGQTAGQLYSSNNLFQPSNAVWIWHPGPFKAFADSTWIEVIHMGGLGDEHIGAWFFHAKGSGIWVNVSLSRARASTRRVASLRLALPRWSHTSLSL